MSSFRQVIVCACALCMLLVFVDPLCAAVGVPAIVTAARLSRRLVAHVPRLRGELAVLTVVVMGASAAAMGAGIALQLQLLWALGLTAFLVPLFASMRADIEAVDAPLCAASH